MSSTDNDPARGWFVGFWNRTTETGVYIQGLHCHIISCPLVPMPTGYCSILEEDQSEVLVE